MNVQIQITETLITGLLGKTYPKGNGERAFSVPAFLMNMALAKDFDHKDVLIFDHICKKVDVARKVHCIYDSNLIRPVGEELLDADLISLLTGLLLILADEQRDPKFLNSALKLLEGRGANAPPTCTKELNDYANALLMRY